MPHNTNYKEIMAARRADPRYQSGIQALSRVNTLFSQATTPDGQQRNNERQAMQEHPRHPTPMARFAGA